MENLKNKVDANASVLRGRTLVLSVLHAAFNLILNPSP
jgi:hypothetical protein